MALFGADRGIHPAMQYPSAMLGILKKPLDLPMMGRSILLALAASGQSRTGSNDRETNMSAKVPHPHAHPLPAPSLNRVAFSATVHCLTGCAIGEVLGMVIGTALNWSAVSTILLAVILAFFFGYLLTMLPLLRAGLPLPTAVRTALAADSVSITIMEVVDNAIMLAIPGAMDAGVAAPLFWGSLAVALLIAGVAAFPVNRWLIARGWGHAIVHKHHAETGGPDHRHH